MTKSYPYHLLSSEVYDGDTVKAVLDLGFGTRCDKSLRIQGIDAPEVRTRCPFQKYAALLVKQVLYQFMISRYDWQFLSTKRSKFEGRAIGQVFVPGHRTETDVGAYLLRNQLVVPYQGNKRKEWELDKIKDITHRALKILSLDE